MIHNMRNIMILATLGAASLFSACDFEVACTEEFRSITIEIPNGPLDDAYTVRVATGDTLGFNNQTFVENVYTVLDDSYQSEIENSEETFIFIGEVGGQVVIEEEYVIEADMCHINKVSGATSANIP